MSNLDFFYGQIAIAQTLMQCNNPKKYEEIQALPIFMLVFISKNTKEPDTFTEYVHAKDKYQANEHGFGMAESVGYYLSYDETKEVAELPTIHEIVEPSEIDTSMQMAGDN